MNFSQLQEIGESGCVMFRIRGLRFDVEKLAEFYRNVCKPLAKVIPDRSDRSYGGWSLLSRDGSYQDGWMQQYKGQDAHLYGYKDFVYPTDLGKHPAVVELIRTLTDVGLIPRRTRIAEIDGAGGNMWHTDGEWTPRGRWRGHIAIITNPDATFEWRLKEGGKEFSTNVPADGHIYMIRADIQHRVRNLCGERVHVLTDFENLMANARVERILAVNVPVEMVFSVS